MKTVKDYKLFTTEFAKTQIITTRKNKHCYFAKFVPTLSKQSKAQQDMGTGYAFFCPSNKLTF